ncbi:integrase core domain-containing protein [Halomonas sp. HK25]|uniref:integrase core domain-containing protein n=1 Tax=Halomonas sp. HK25 TaxID=3394321 RepID=UPI0039FBB9D4
MLHISTTDIIALSCSAGSSGSSLLELGATTTTGVARVAFFLHGLVECFFRSLKEECIWQHRFESLGQARAVIGRWIRYYNEERPHQYLAMWTPGTSRISRVGCEETWGALQEPDSKLR